MVILHQSIFITFLINFSQEFFNHIFFVLKYFSSMNNVGGIQWRGVRGVQRRQFRNRLEELVNRISERVLQEVMRHLEDTLEDRLIQLISERLPDILIERLPSVVEDMMDDVANGVMERLETRNDIIQQSAIDRMVNSLIGDTAENQQQGQHEVRLHLNPDNGHESDSNESDIDESDRELIPLLET